MALPSIIAIQRQVSVAMVSGNVWLPSALCHNRQQLCCSTISWLQRGNKAADKSRKQLLKARAVADSDDRAELLQQADVQQLTSRLKAAPIIQPPDEMYNAAMKVVRKVRPRDDLKKEGPRAANKAARALDTLMKQLTGKLNGYMKAFPQFSSLHPFEQSMLDLSVGVANYSRILENGDKLRRAVIQVGKAYATKASRAVTAAEAEAAEAAGVRMVETVLLDRGKPILNELKELSRTLRAVPSIDLLVPTLALVGAPNVGKSSLVNVLSSGTPEVCNYPFTTRSIKMGHFYVNQIRHQVTDTPGLLQRPDEERNAMEKLTLATLQHLPTATVLVMDLTEECGCSVAQQWAIRSELLRRFPHKLWIDVISKGDLLEEEFDAADEAGCCEPPAADASPRDAVQAVQWLPHAIRVSSVTEEGIEDMKAAVLALMDARNWASQIEFMRQRDKSVLAEQGH